MKKLRYIFTVFIMLISIKNVKASNCSYEELGKLTKGALEIKTSYEFKEDRDDTGYITTYFKISAVNVPNNLYAVVSGDNGTKTTLQPGQDGIVAFNSYSVGTVIKFKFEFYSNDTTSCPNEKITELYLKQPMVNPYYSTGYCLADPDNSFCDRFVFENVSMEDYDKFAKTTIKNERKKNEEIRKENEKDQESNKIYIIAAVAGGIIVIGFITYQVIRRRGQKL